MLEASKRRRRRILEVLASVDGPMATNTIAQMIDEPYSRVYQDLRSLCGSHTVPYQYGRESVCAGPEYPVIWHPWSGQRSKPNQHAGAAMQVTWELNPDYVGNDIAQAREEQLRAEAEAMEAIRRSISALS